jgi:Zn finger protein HypA/HybF involved in hydrogenase expression
MTPDQILAITAGLSPEVAKIFAERAHVVSADVDKREALLREMVALSGQGRMASEEQARFFFDKAMQGTAASRAAAHPEGDAVETLECPGCHKRPPRTDRFCRYCGYGLRA